MSGGGGSDEAGQVGRGAGSSSSMRWGEEKGSALMQVGGKIGKVGSGKENWPKQVFISKDFVFLVLIIISILFPIQMNST
jgi:hypothetical protein